VCALSIGYPASDSVRADVLPVAKTGHIQLLTCLRGLAAWWVVAFHLRVLLAGVVPQALFDLLSHGYLAVDLFFVLSGFVIYINYQASLQTLTRRSLLRFFAARLARIYPLHLVIMVLFLVETIAILLFSTAAQTEYRDPPYYVMSLLLVHNWGFTDYLGWNVPSWSISTEAFAYILFPFMCLGLARIDLRGPGLVAAMAASVVALALLVRWHGDASLGTDIPRMGLVRCVLEFLAGVCLGRMHRAYGPPQRLAQVLALAAAGVLIAVYAGASIADYWLMPAAFCLMVYGLTRDLEDRAWSVGLAVFVYLGQISYSTYLVHWLVRDGVSLLYLKSFAPNPHGFAIYIVAVLIASVILFHTVEEPGRRLVRELLQPRRG